MPALAAAMVAALVAVPVALGLWQGGMGLRVTLGGLVAIAPAAGFALATLTEGDAMLWGLSQAASGMPVIVLAMMVRLSAITPGSLRIAAVSGLSPFAAFRHVIWPLMLPGALGGFVLVFAAVLAGRLPLVTALVLPIAAVTAGLVAIRTRG